jgi:hypothetical protein
MPNIDKILLSESLIGEPIKVTGLTAVSTVNRAVTSNIATIEATSHGLINDDYIYLSGMTDSTYNGIHQVTRVDDNHFTFPLTHADEAEAVDAAGTVQKVTKIHECSSDADTLDEIWGNVTNIASSNAQLVLLYGEQEPSDYYTVASKDSKRVVIAGEIGINGLTVYAYSDTANALKMSGSVMRKS